MNMRKNLEKRFNQRLRWKGIVEKFGKKWGYHGYQELTVLIINITCISEKMDEIITDHIWMTVRKLFEKIEISPGDIIEFDARVSAYSKGNRDEETGEYFRSMDYKLSFPTKIKIIGKDEKIASLNGDYSQKVKDAIFQHNENLKNHRIEYVQEKKEGIPIENETKSERITVRKKPIKYGLDFFLQNQTTG